MQAAKMQPMVKANSGLGRESTQWEPPTEVALTLRLLHTPPMAAHTTGQGKDKA